MPKNKLTKTPKYYLDRNGEFVIENYNFAKPFANFFPGIAGKYGIPMWVFYVNRGQAIASFGTKDKDHAILEFFPANKSWESASLRGFRTFIKIFNAKKINFYEPFHNGFVNLGFNLANKMSISSYGLKLEEDNTSLGLRVKVEYFNIPNDCYAGLGRIVTIQNLGKAAKKIQLIDGLPQIVPFGTNNLFLKQLSRTAEAWMNVENLENKVPFYKLAVDPTDRPEVIHIQEGNFYLGFIYNQEKPKIIKPIVDPESVFGAVTDFSCPYQFLNKARFIQPKKEMDRNKTPCGFVVLDLELGGQEEKAFYSVIGYMRSKKILNSSLAKITKFGYLANKAAENKNIINSLQDDIDIKSNCPEFDLYAKQTYLDNIIRGGYPINLAAGKQGSPVFYLYSRKHGDLERDYNKFYIQPAYFSQGNGNYRDINQNRRCDNWFNPQVKQENIVTFFNLLQADGFNPLVVKGLSFSVDNSQNPSARLKDIVKEKDILKITSFLAKPFTPGEVILFVEENKIKLRVSYDEFLGILLSCSSRNQEAEHGEGFWIDHWTYNLDLLENYLKLYPENLKDIVFGKKIFTFYDNTETVRPRQEKYIAQDGQIRQFHAVCSDSAKKELIHKRTFRPHIVRADYGKGEIYETTLINKLFCLFANKLASLDPFGAGLEMEAGKPNWFDALNGLPALFGSSLCETFELKRLAMFIKEAIEKTHTARIYLSEETSDFLLNLGALLKEYLDSGCDDKDFQYWDKSSLLKENYRQKTRFGFSGKETEAAAPELIALITRALQKIDFGIAKAKDRQKDIYCPYFINEVTAYEPLKTHFVKPTKFLQKKLPLFLEAQMHALRLADSPETAKSIYRATKASGLYDKKLKMYKVTAPLKDMPEEIGRCRVFTPGWLENESIWLHMEYKYLLEVLRAGLYEEFYQDFKNVLIPFQKPQTYGRSILENSSFIVSSAYPDKRLHGNGFLARLSGSTAEFLNIWLIMNVGKEPFILDNNNRLNLKFSPILAGWLFKQKERTYSFNFLSKIRVTYHNPRRKDTFGKNAARPQKIAFRDKDGNPVEISCDTIPHPYAEQARSRQINAIDIYLV